LKLEPAAGRLEAGAAVELVAVLAVPDAGTLSGELLIHMARAHGGSDGTGSIGTHGGGGSTNGSGTGSNGGGGNVSKEAASQQGAGGAAGERQWDKELAARCPVGAAVVACTYELRSEGGGCVKAVRGPGQ
jgi:hypothetical protein